MSAALSLVRSAPSRQRDLVLHVDEDSQTELARRAMDGLADSSPDVSARQVLTHQQKVVGIVVGVVLVVLAIPFPLGVGRTVAVLLTLLYGAAVLYRVRCFARGLRGSQVHHVDDKDACDFPADELPIYTVLVPAYREPEVIGALLRNVAKLNYPADKLDVMILLEADDDVTLDAVREANPADYVRVVVVPTATLTTKPRACNYGLEFARGSLVTIFDAEDEPDVLQLRKAAIVFASRPPEVVCLQARLAYSNADQNIVTKWFTVEYLTWFNQFLPGLAELGSPIPLGGTSNHLRIGALQTVGGWDPYNVTEDADLGLRLAREGYRVENLDSVTFEEANSDFINWVKQRSRWLKGYLLTWLVHMRHPVQLKRQLGWRGFAGVNLFIGGTPLLAVINPLVWSLTLLWFLGKPPIIQELFSGPIYFLALFTWLLGNFAIIYMGLITIRETNRPELLASTLVVPLYWVMMAIAAVKGVMQLIRDPAYWEKTTHGLGTSTAAPAAEGQPPATNALPAADARPDTIPDGALDSSVAPATAAPASVAAPPVVPAAPTPAPVIPDAVAAAPASAPAFPRVVPRPTESPLPADAALRELRAAARRRAGRLPTEPRSSAARAAALERRRNARISDEAALARLRGSVTVPDDGSGDGIDGHGDDRRGSYAGVEGSER